MTEHRKTNQETEKAEHSITYNSSDEEALRNDRERDLQRPHRICVDM